jgi:hypothetical protein
MKQQMIPYLTANTADMHSRPKRLPWTTLFRTFEDRGCEIINWPPGVPKPGTGHDDDDNKGASGLLSQHRKLLYEAVTRQDSQRLWYRRPEIIGGSAVENWKDDNGRANKRRRIS